MISVNTHKQLDCMLYQHFSWFYSNIFCLSCFLNPTFKTTWEDWLMKRKGKAIMGQSQGPDVGLVSKPSSLKQKWKERTFFHTVLVLLTFDRFLVHIPFLLRGFTYYRLLRTDAFVIMQMSYLIFNYSSLCCPLNSVDQIHLKSVSRKAHDTSSDGYLMLIQMLAKENHLYQRT